jgi:hypothetical protein
VLPDDGMDRIVRINAHAGDMVAKEKRDRLKKALGIDPSFVDGTSMASIGVVAKKALGIDPSFVDGTSTASIGVVAKKALGIDPSLVELVVKEGRDPHKKKTKEGRDKHKKVAKEGHDKHKKKAKGERDRHKKEAKEGRDPHKKEAKGERDRHKKEAKEGRDPHKKAKEGRDRGVDKEMECEMVDIPSSRAKGEGGVRSPVCGDDRYRHQAASPPRQRRRSSVGGGMGARVTGANSVPIGEARGRRSPPRC